MSSVMTPVSAKSERLHPNASRNCGAIAAFVYALRLRPALRPAVAAASGCQLVRSSAEIAHIAGRADRI